IAHDLLTDRSDLCIVAVRIDVDLTDGRAGYDVVELVQERELPGPFQVLRGVGCEAAGPHAGQEFGVAQEELALAVSALVASLSRIGASVQLQIELADPYRQVLRVGLRLLEEIPREL